MIPYHRAHHDLCDIAQHQSRIPIPKEILDGIDNAELHDPGNLGNVEVTGKHERLLRERALTKARAHARLFRTKPKLRFKDPLHFHLAHGLQPKGQFGAQAWLLPAYILAETLHDGYFIGLDGIKHGQKQDRADQHQHPNDNDASGQVGERRTRWEVSPPPTLVPSHTILFSLRG